MSRPFPHAPDWLTVRHGSGSVVVVAPHGGIRRRPIRRGDGMNDLHTADLALELAERLDAFALVNHARDRNDVDLNRVRQLVANEPRFLSLLRDGVERIHAGGSVPLVLFIHGWNMAVPWCDVGVGLRERSGVLFGRHPTVGRQTYGTLVEPLVARLFEEGLGGSIGLRYPAAGRDNATQLFSGRHADHAHEDVAALSRMGAVGAVDAVQLELGIPLRWPGWRRERFVDVLCETLDVDDRGRPARRRAARAEFDVVAADRSRSWGLQAKPPATEMTSHGGCAVQAALSDGTGIFMGAEPTGSATMAARLCVALADGSMLLFVGEGPWSGRAGEYAVAGFHWHENRDEQAAAVRVRMVGPVVHYPTHEAFVDLEKGLAGSRLLEAEVVLEYRALQENNGILEGSILAGNVSLDLRVPAACERGGRRSAVSRARVRLHLTTGWREARTFESGGRGAAEGACAIELGARVGDPVVVYDAGEAVARGTICIAVPVFRPLADGRVAKVTFGTARFDDGAAPRLAVYESIELHDPAKVARR